MLGFPSQAQVLVDSPLASPRRPRMGKEIPCHSLSRLTLLTLFSAFSSRRPSAWYGDGGAAGSEDGDVEAPACEVEDVEKRDEDPEVRGISMEVDMMREKCSWGLRTKSED